MSGVGRNDPCACGSGAKYKRCCLDGESGGMRELASAEAALERLGALAWEVYPEDCEEAFERHYDGGLPAFGLLGPSDEELRRAEAWFLLDRRLGIGATPLECLAERLEPGGGMELLARSELRMWRIAGDRAAASVGARCPVTGEDVRLVTAPNGSGSATGELVVARTLPLAPGRAALLAPTPVDPAVAEELVRWTRETWESAEDQRGFWRTFGGELSRAASAWPEERVHSRDGEIVQSALSTWAIRKPERAAELLASDPELEERPVEEVDSEGERSWMWRRAAEALPRAAITSRPGVRWVLDEHEAGERPRLAQLDLVPWEKRLWIFASTPGRLRSAEERAASALGRTLGRRMDHDCERPFVIPRWQQLRLDAFAKERSWSAANALADAA